MPDSKEGSTPEEEERVLQEAAMREQAQYGTVACELCQKEVPISLAHTEEAEDYVHYFCGLECYDKWEHPNKTDKEDHT